MGPNLVRRIDIQVLRGLAVIAVVLFHAFERIFPNGYLGVDMFFVISGFVVGPMILKVIAESDLSDRFKGLIVFFKRRFFRLAPALTFVLIFSTLIILAFGSPEDHYRFSMQGITTLLLVGNFGAYKYSGSYFAPNVNPLIHTWSLSVEEQIYIFLPLALFFLVTIKILKIQGPRVFILFMFLLTASLMSFLNPGILGSVYSQFQITNFESASFYSSFDRLWEFLLGAVIALCRFSPPMTWTGVRIGNTLVVSFLLLLVFLPLIVPSKIGQVMICAVTSLAIIFKCMEYLPRSATKALEWLGDRSYSIYLLHMPLIYLGLHSPFFAQTNEFKKSIVVACFIIVTLVLGNLSYLFIEERYRSKYQTKSSLKGFTTIAATAFLLPLAGFTILIIGEKENYWGLETLNNRPSFAGFLDPNCDRYNNQSGSPCTYEKTGGGVLTLNQN